MSQLLKSLKGTGVALVTPFKKDGSVDYDALYKLVQHIIKGKCEYLVVLGTTGESVTLTEKERKIVVKSVIDAAAGKVPIVLGVGGNNTAEVVRTLKTIDFTGIDAILSVSPYYNKPTQQGIFEHYKVVAKSAPVPVIIYNVPSRTGSNITAETNLKIANEIKNVIGTKEASGNIEQVMAIIQNRPKDFLVISGDDAITLPLIAAGADGLISVIANAYPLACSEMVRTALKGDFVKARKLHYSFYSLIPLLFAEGNPAGVKVILKYKRISDDVVRLPLVKVSKELEKKLIEFAKKIK
jgi:4-hydroxy-tetrahydrodipicolinate synthase